MPPVRWKKFFHVMAIVIQVAATTTDAQHMHQDPYSQSSGGWVPIVSHRRQQPGYEPAITQYANPSHPVDLVKADVANFETTTPNFRKTSIYYKVPVKGNAKVVKAAGTMTKQILKTRNGGYITSPGGYHNAHIPLTAGSQSNPQQVFNRQSPPQKKVYVAKKTVNVVQSKPKKPLRIQGPVISHSSKNEVFASAPNTASFSIVKSLQPNVIHTRETQGLGIFGGAANHQFPSSTNQQNAAHFDFGNHRFTLAPQNNVYDHSPSQNLFFAKPVQDDFSRNLVPPPISRIHHGNSQQNAIHSQSKPHDISITAPSAGFDQFGTKFSGVNQIQAPSFQNPVRVKTNEQAIDVQVTREQVKQFEVQSPFNSQNSYTAGFVRPITYEVTESTRFFESPDFQFRPQPNQAYFKLGNVQNVANFNPGLQNFNSARPGLVFQAQPVSTTRPPFSVSPVVDLSEPAFLPTPFKVDTAVVPTSQSLTDVSTVFAQVTQRNKFRNSQQYHPQQNSPFFEVQDISTHFPVLGNVQDVGGEDGTEPPAHQQHHDDSELTNEITTHPEIEKETLKPSVPTKASPGRDPTRTRVVQRRRKPSTTTTTEPPVVETYEPIRSQESDSASIPSSENEDSTREVERPHRRRRPRPPNQTRIKSSKEEETENIPPVRRPISEENVQRRPSSEENRLRGRHRFRPRGKYTQTQSNEYASIPTRSRVRPSRPEPTSYEEATEASLEQNSVENHFGSYSEEKVTESQELEKLKASREKITPRPFIEEVHENYHSSGDKLVEATTKSTTTTTTEDSLLREFSTMFHLPENEVDYTTQSSPSHEEHTTGSSTTTTSTPETTTSKFVRARIRTNKFDNANRPKFSVKDYRQKLDQLTSTVQPTSTDSHRSTPQNNLRLRFPQRTRGKLNSQPTTTAKATDEDSVTDQTTTIRSKFKPKDPRFHQTTTESETIATEKNVKLVNTRTRNFGKPKLNLEITTTNAPKVSIKPNLFSARRRVQHPSLKNRIQIKNKKNETEEATEAFPGEGEIMVSTETHVFFSTTESALNKETIAESSPTEYSDTTTDEILKDDFSQRISDLTSSFKDNFKSVSPTSRRIPNHFTISTDDPILPIEAFFPNLKQDSKEKTDTTSDDT